MWPAVRYSACEQDLASSTSLEFVRSELRRCTLEHINYTPLAPSGTAMPKRLLDLGYGRGRETSAVVRLIETNAKTPIAPYICLSHRWGLPGQTYVTQKSTLEKHKIAILIQDLSQVYQDAICIVRRLDPQYRYLWIDSLCIVHDDSEQESSHWRARVKRAPLYMAAMEAACVRQSSIRRTWRS